MVIGCRGFMGLASRSYGCSPTCRAGRQRARPSPEQPHRLHEPISRFIYWNMNYHIEHHMFPMVPYHALPKLHERIKDDLPEPTPSMFAGYKEVIPILLRQLRHEDYFLRRDLPPTAKPYRDDLHAEALGVPAQ